MDKTILNHFNTKFALFPQCSYLFLYYNLLPTGGEERHEGVNSTSEDTVQNVKQKTSSEITAPDFYMPRGAKTRKGSSIKP